MSDGTNVKLNFEGIIPRSDYWREMNYYDGYQGFDFTDMLLITKKGLHVTAPPGTGYYNVLHGDAELLTVGGFNTQYGWITSPVPGETFNLKSGIFAAGDNTSLPTEFYALNANGQTIGHLDLILDDTATTIDFTNYGHSFRNASTIMIVSYANASDDTVVMDNLKIHWNGPIPHGGRMPSIPTLPVHRHHPHIAHALSLGATQAHDGHSASDAGGTNSHHGELMSLAAALGHADPGGGLTARFVLPHCDHFGT
ncbi:MAG TPA: hypothetical protein VGI20_04130 [Rhizomicrobium sp.]